MPAFPSKKIWKNTDKVIAERKIQLAGKPTSIIKLLGRILELTC